MQLFPLDHNARSYLEYTATASGAGDAIVNIAANALEFWVIDHIAWSYGGTPTSGNLLIEINSVTVFSVDITAAGPGHFNFTNQPIYTDLVAGLAGGPTLNLGVVVTLADGTVANKLFVRHR